MRKISSRLTVFYKRVFPVLWIAMILVNIVALALAWPADAAHRGMAIAIPIMMAIFGYLLFRWLIFDLVDEVFIDGAELMIRNRGHEDRIPLANLESIRATQFFHPERITVVANGTKYTFAAPARLNWLSPHPVAEELRKLKRVHKMP